MNKGTLYIGGLVLAILVTLVCWAEVSHNGPALRAIGLVEGLFSKKAIWNTPVSETASTASHKSSTISTWHAINLSVDPKAPFSSGVLEARISVDGKKYAFRANQLRSFPQVYIKEKQKASVTVHFDEGQPGDPVPIQVRDGGGIAGNNLVQVQKLDQNLAVNFTFTAGTQDGIYRVTLGRGDDMQTVNFWVGQPLQMQGLAKSN